MESLSKEKNVMMEILLVAMDVIQIVKINIVGMDKSTIIPMEQ